MLLSCLESPMDGEAWWAIVHGVAKSRTRLSDFTFTFHFLSFLFMSVVLWYMFCPLGLSPTLFWRIIPVAICVSSRLLTSTLRNPVATPPTVYLPFSLVVKTFTPFAICHHRHHHGDRGVEWDSPPTCLLIHTPIRELLWAISKSRIAGSQGTCKVEILAPVLELRKQHLAHTKRNWGSRMHFQDFCLQILG